MLEARHLTKTYATIPAVADASFEIRPGEILGYLGPNGSGKSSTVNMLTGLLEPTRGHVAWRGRDIREQLLDYRRALGYVPEEPHLYAYLSAQEYLEMAGQLRGLPQKPLQEKIEGLLQLFGLHSSRHSAISSYSKGMKQKVLISAALLHNPEVLIFDEPLSGLDVTTAMIFRHLLSELRAAGKIILYSSHVLEVVEKVATRVVILHQGKVVAHDSVSNLRGLMSLPSLEDIFSQLVLQEDTESTARQMVELMRL